MSGRATYERSERRVQRPIDLLPIVHLEAEVPSPEPWSLLIDGLVAGKVSWSVDEIRAMPAEERVWDFHCVWGWSRPDCRWEGVGAGRLLDAAGPLADGRYVVVRAIEGPYASCFSLDEARDGFVAWGMDGKQLPPEHGGPLRFIPPPGKWAYKGVKWAGGMTVIDSFAPGFWEEMVGNPIGDIPPEMLDLRFE